MKIIFLIKFLLAANTNLILNASGSMSSTYVTWPATYGNDGNYHDGLFTHTKNDLKPFAWIEYTLPAPTLISSVFIFMRECCQARYNFTLTVGYSSLPYNNPVCYDFSKASKSPRGYKSGWYQCSTAMFGTKVGL